MNSSKYRFPMSATLSVALTAFVLLVTGSTAQAQITMSVSNPLMDEYPIVKLPIQVRDNSSLITTLSLSYFNIYENGTDRPPMFLDCATDTLWESLSFLLVLDVSESMGYKFGTRVDDPMLLKWNAALEAFNAVIDAMRPSDGGLFYTLWRYPELVVPFTTNKDSLRAGLDSLEFKERTPIYDTILEVLNTAANIGGRRVMILLTDGSDFGSFSTQYDAIALAQQMGIPIYIIGLDVAPKDHDILRMISVETGGEYNYAPTAEELQVVMFNIAESIQTKECILAFRTDDTCRNGQVRDIEIRVSVGAEEVKAFTDYSLPYDPEFVDIELGEPSLQVDDDSPIAIPLSVTGPLRKDRYLKIYTELIYDPNVLAFKGIDSSKGIASMTNPSMYPHPTRPDSYIFACNRIGLHEDIEAAEMKTLFSFEFDALHQDSTVVSQVELNQLSVSQHCPITPTATSIPFTVIGCPAVAVGIDSSVLAYGGSEFIVPLKLQTDAGDIGSPLEYLFTVRYDPEFVSYKRMLHQETMSEHLNVSVTEPEPGFLRILGLKGTPEPLNDDIIRLVFEAQHTDDVRQVSMIVENGAMVHSCTPVVNLSGASILLDGTCNKLVRRREFFLDQNAPNPVSKSLNGTTEIAFRAREGEPVQLQVFDTEGRPVETLVNMAVDDRHHSVRFNTGDLPAGVYFYTLSQGDNLWTRKMVVRE